MINMAVADKNMRSLQNLSRRELVQITKIKYQSLAGIAVVQEKSGIAERRIQGFYIPGQQQNSSHELKF